MCVQANGASCNERADAAAPTEDTGKFSFPKAPVFMKAPVVTGFGRGSKQMGIPTANMLPDVLREQLEGMQRGVYFGWARLPHLEGNRTTGEGEAVKEEEGEGEAGKGGPRVLKMVLNVGRRPTFVDGDDVTVEVHILSSFEDDFYGEELQVVVLGYIRPERKFSSLDDLHPPPPHHQPLFLPSPSPCPCPCLSSQALLLTQHVPLHPQQRQHLHHPLLSPHYPQPQRQQQQQYQHQHHHQRQQRQQRHQHQQQQQQRQQRHQHHQHQQQQQQQRQQRHQHQQQQQRLQLLPQQLSACLFCHCQHHQQHHHHQQQEHQQGQLPRVPRRSQTR
ncbi:unnamed protein product [Closterium sp. NIES-54]